MVGLLTVGLIVDSDFFCWTIFVRTFFVRTIYVAPRRLRADSEKLFRNCLLFILCFRTFEESDLSHGASINYSTSPSSRQPKFFGFVEGFQTPSRRLESRPHHDLAKTPKAPTGVATFGVRAKLSEALALKPRFSSHRHCL